MANHRKARHILAHRVPWNVTSAIVNPLATFFASIVILHLSVSRGQTLIAILPIAVLATTSLAALAFWLIRLAGSAATRARLILAVGTVTHVVGLVAFLCLLVGVGIAAVGPANLGMPLHAPAAGYKYWIFVLWASLESTQHFLYKLSFGKRDTLAYVIQRGNSGAWRLPLGGAIGVELRKLREEENRRKLGFRS